MSMAAVERSERSEVAGTRTRMNIFKPDERYEGVRPIQFYFQRLLFGLMFLFVGFDAWSGIVKHQGPWNPVSAAALCMFASYSTLSILGVFRPLKMIPILLFMVVYNQNGPSDSGISRNVTFRQCCLGFFHYLPEHQRQREYTPLPHLAGYIQRSVH